LAKINEIHLSLIQTFAFCQKNSKFERKFNFLDNVDKYFEKVLKDNKALRKEKKEIEDIGQLRSVLDIPISEKRINADGFFKTLKNFYDFCLKHEMDKKLLFPPHFPCAIDIIPSVDKRYQVMKSTLPGTLQATKEFKMSSSMRIYPAGIASLRFGYFFRTENNFKVEDIIDFLVNKRTCIKLNDKELSIYSLSQKVAEKTIEKLLKDGKPSLSWVDTHSIIDIVKATDLQPFEQNKKEIFLPLLKLQKSLIDENDFGENLSDRNDLILTGKKSIVTYLPNSNSNCDRRKVRRWFRNFVEFLSIQKFITAEIDAILLSQEYKQFSSNWKTDFGKLFKNKDIVRLFSLWFYTTLHMRNGTFKKGKWRERYHKFLKVLDHGNVIQTSNDALLTQLAVLQKEAREAEARIGDRITKFVDLFKKGLDAVSSIV
jgi:hypothetical protein